MEWPLLSMLMPKVTFVPEKGDSEYQYSMSLRAAAKRVAL